MRRRRSWNYPGVCSAESSRGRAAAGWDSHFLVLFLSGEMASAAQRGGRRGPSYSGAARGVEPIRPTSPTRPRAGRTSARPGRRVGAAAARLAGQERLQAVSARYAAAMKALKVS